MQPVVCTRPLKAGLIQGMIGESAMARQELIESGAAENCWRELPIRTMKALSEEVPISRPDPDKNAAAYRQLQGLQGHGRSQQAVNKALDESDPRCQ